MVPLLSLLGAVVLHATLNPTLDKITADAPPRAICDTKYTQFDQWAGEESADPPAETLAEAMKALEDLPAPTSAELSLWRTEMKRDVAQALPSYLKTLGGSCTQAFLRNGKILSRAMGRSPAHRKKFLPRWTKLLKRPQYETLLDGMIGFVLLEYALDQKVWEATPAVRKAIAGDRATSKAELEVFTKKFNPLFNRADIGTAMDLKEQTARLAKFPERDAIRDGILEEMDLAARIQTRVRGFYKKLVP